MQHDVSPLPTYAVFKNGIEVPHEIKSSIES
jgi:hypothetical protein